MKLALSIALLFPMLAHAGDFRFVAEYPPLATADQRAAFEKLLRELERKLPPVYKQILSRTIRVTFRPEKENSGPWCMERSKIKKGFFQSTGDASEIELDQSLLAPNKLEKFFEAGSDCSPGGALLQNLSLLVDANVELTEAEAALKRSCEDREYRDQNSRECGLVQAIEGWISSQPKFQKLRNFDSDRSSKGELVQRSPDPSEFVRAKHAFAVNAQLFLTDPEFPCRRPATARYLEKELGHKPFPASACTQNPVLYTQTHPEPARIDRDRVYQMHYLWAGPGEAAMSRWGHAMIRIVQCAPHRTRVDEKCLEDIDHHLVVSYRAYVDEMAISTWKGLVGDYPSQLLLMRYRDVVNEYTRGEHRDLFSLPLKLGKEKRDLLLDNVIEQYWNYRGRYKFLSTNCATETKDLLQVVDDGGVLSKFGNDDTLTPSYLFESLQAHGLAEDLRGVSREDLLARKLLVESEEAFLKRPYARLRSQLTDLPEKIEDFYKKTSSAERLRYFRSLSPEKRKAQAPVFYMLELNAKEVKQAAMDKQLFKMLESYRDDKSHPLNDLILRYQERLKAINASLQPWELPKPDAGYGVPFPRELKAENPVADPIAAREKLILDLQKQVPKLLPDDWEELQRIRSQLEVYKNAALATDVNREVERATTQTGKSSDGRVVETNAAPKQGPRAAEPETSVRETEDAR